MADLATATKTLEALRKAYDAGDAAKTSSLIGTLKVRLRRPRRAGARPGSRADARVP
jgi:hypothetical protein